jgi:hypothetical protein
MYSVAGDYREIELLTPTPSTQATNNKKKTLY